MAIAHAAVARAGVSYHSLQREGYPRGIALAPAQLTSRNAGRPAWPMMQLSLASVGAGLCGLCRTVLPPLRCGSPLPHRCLKWPPNHLRATKRLRTPDWSSPGCLSSPAGSMLLADQASALRLTPRNNPRAVPIPDRIIRIKLHCGLIGGTANEMVVGACDDHKHASVWSFACLSSRRSGVYNGSE